MQLIEDILPNNIIQIKKNITLNELYSGRYITDEVGRKTLCPSCLGVGSDDGVLRACKKCRGRRILTSMENNNIQLRLCEFCNGIGIDAKSHKCKTCDGYRVINEKHQIKYLIPVGVKHNDEIVVKNQGNINICNDCRYDIKIVIQILEDEIYKTIHTNKDETVKLTDLDLMTILNVPLVNALCGIKKNLQHPSGETIKYETNNIIQIDNISIIENGGIPEKNNKNIRGKLFIKTKIIFPESVDETMKKQLFDNLHSFNQNDF